MYYLLCWKTINDKLKTCLCYLNNFAQKYIKKIRKRKARVVYKTSNLTALKFENNKIVIVIAFAESNVSFCLMFIDLN